MRIPLLIPQGIPSYTADMLRITGVVVVLPVDAHPTDSFLPVQSRRCTPCRFWYSLARYLKKSSQLSLAVLPADGTAGHAETKPDRADLSLAAGCGMLFGLLLTRIARAGKGNRNARRNIKTRTAFATSPPSAGTSETPSHLPCNAQARLGKIFSASFPLSPAGCCSDASAVGGDSRG